MVEQRRCWLACLLHRIQARPVCKHFAHYVWLSLLSLLFGLPLFCLLELLLIRPDDTVPSRLKDFPGTTEGSFGTDLCHYIVHAAVENA